MARITIDVDLPPEVEITGHQWYQDGHGLEVRWPLPARCRCEKCGHDDVAHIEFKQVFDSSPAILAVSPFAMERQLYSLATHGATS